MIFTLLEGEYKGNLTIKKAVTPEELKEGNVMAWALGYKDYREWLECQPPRRIC